MQRFLSEATTETDVRVEAHARAHRKFFAFCEANPDLRIELTAQGRIEVMPPTGSETGKRNLVIGSQLYLWMKKDARGWAYDSSTGFQLPNGAVRSPDACWVLRSRVDVYSRQQREKSLPLCPDFVIELTSPSDRLRQVQAKMKEYMENGAQLGWLLHPNARTVHIYRPDQVAEKLIAPTRLVGEEPVGGFILELAEVWDPE